MAEEVSALQRQGTWSLTPPVLGKNVVGCKWVYKIKRHPDGSITRYLVVKQATIRIILSIVVHFNWTLQQLDVTNAFLHGILTEEIYMTQSLGFVDPTTPNHVYNLHKSLYGLKQAPCEWFQRFYNFLLSLGYNTTYVDPSLFIRHHRSTITVILLCGDDLIITRNDSQYITSLIHQMSLLFEMKHLGRLITFLALKFIPPFFVTNQNAKNLLERASLLGCKLCGSPSNYKSCHSA